LHAFR